MEGPIRGVRFIHRALGADAAAIEVAAHAPSVDAGALADRVAFLARVNKLHTDGEETTIFAEIEARRPGVPATYLHDHKAEREIFDAIVALAREMAGDPSDAQVARLRRQTIALHEHLTAHIAKEEELIVPLVEELFTPAEQGALLGRMIGAFPPEEMRDILPWLVGNLSPDDRVTYLGEMKQVAPPERFAAIAGWVRAKVDPEVWSAIAARVPGL